MNILEKAKSRKVHLPADIVPTHDEIEAVLAYINGTITMPQLEYGFGIAVGAGPAKVRTVLCQAVRHNIVSIVVKPKK